MKIKLINILILCFFIGSCSTSRDNWFVRFWNDGYHSEKRKKQFSNCVNKANELYPGDKNLNKRMEYLNHCMKYK